MEMKFKRIMVNCTILDTPWIPFFQIMKFDKPIGKVYSMFFGRIFINIIKRKAK